MDFDLEICVNSIESAMAAQAGGASRIELCDNMAEGGTTPSAGLISRSKKKLNIPVFPIIRPRGGDFLYSDEEFEVMKQDIKYCKEQGCEGVVIGILKADGSIDTERCRDLILQARPMQVTFHRAFDRCNDLQKGLEDIISLGCERVLTSGGEITATNAIFTLSRLVNQARGRIIIMAGSGINENNIIDLALKTGIKEFHSSAKSTINTKMSYQGAGKLAELDGRFPIMESNVAKIENMKKDLLQL